MTEGSWRAKELKDVDPTLQVNVLQDVYGIKYYLTANKDGVLAKGQYVRYFLQKVQEFYIAALQIKTRFPIGNPMIESLTQMLIIQSLHRLFLLPFHFPKSFLSQSLQTLDNEWRKLAIEILPFDKEDMEPEEFWGKLSEVKDGAGSPQFKTLCNFVSSLLCLPHANVDVERIFS